MEPMWPNKSFSMVLLRPAHGTLPNRIAIPRRRRRFPLTPPPSAVAACETSQGLGVNRATAAQTPPLPCRWPPSSHTPRSRHVTMAEPNERDQFTDEEEEEEEDNLEAEMDEQDFGSDDDGGVGGGGGKGKRLRERLSVPGKRGVCYLSRIPPHMNPSHIRQMLSKYGEVLRIYLVPEGQGHRKHASVKAKAYSEGWIEFAKKSAAKRVANLLNGEQIGGKKRSSFYYDIWNIKYLRKFKWDDLVGEMAEKTHIREQKLTLEIAAAKKQRDHYLSNVEKSRALKHIQERRKKKQKTEGTEPSNALEAKIARPIPQKEPVGERGVKSKPNLSKDILAGVFGGSS